MRAYAPKFGGDVEQWGMVGLLHDLDYERHPDLETGHPRIALKELESRGFSEEFVRAVASHADFLGVSRDSPMEKTLFAVDELCGFLMACAYVRPQGIHGMTPKSVKKKMKTPAFAAAIDRDAYPDMAEFYSDLARVYAEEIADLLEPAPEHVVLARIDADPREVAFHGSLLRRDRLTSRLRSGPSARGSGLSPAGAGTNPAGRPSCG